MPACGPIAWLEELPGRIWGERERVNESGGGEERFGACSATHSAGTGLKVRRDGDSCCRFFLIASLASCRDTLDDVRRPRGGGSSRSVSSLEESVSRSSLS